MSTTERPIEPKWRFEDYLEAETRDLAAFIDRVGVAFLLAHGFEVPSWAMPA